MYVLLPIVVTLPRFQLEMSPLKVLNPNTVNKKRFRMVCYQISSIKTIRKADDDAIC